MGEERFVFSFFVFIFWFCGSYVYIYFRVFLAYFIVGVDVIVGTI